MSKQHLTTELEKVTIKHEKAEEYKAKLSRDDDCFAILFDENNPDCQACMVMCTHEGVDMPIRDLCKKLQSFVAKTTADDKPVDESQNNQSQEENMAAKKKAAPKKAKAEGQVGRPSERREQVLECLKKGMKTQGEIVKKLGTQNATVNQVLRKLVGERLVVRKKEGKAFIYELK